MSAFVDVPIRDVSGHQHPNVAEKTVECSFFSATVTAQMQCRMHFETETAERDESIRALPSDANTLAPPPPMSDMEVSNNIEGILHTGRFGPHISASTEAACRDALMQILRRYCE